jgi:hypothetical protein
MWVTLSIQDSSARELITSHLEVSMMPDTHPDDLVAASVLDACSDVEAGLVADHVGRCPRCAAEVARLRTTAQWVGEISPRRPPRGLRERVLAAAMAARPPVDPEVGQLLAPYVAQVAAFDRLLDGLPEPYWSRPIGPHATVRELVRHLRANDALVAGSIVDTGDVKLDWRHQADALLRTVSAEGPRRLDRPVVLAGGAAIRRPLREALTQRAFETWIHAEDVRTLLALPTELPEPAQITRIADFGLRLLPGAMDAAGRGRPYQLIRLTLTGPGGGERLAALSATSPTTGSTVVGEISLPAAVFCRLLAGRVAPPPAGTLITGDRLAAGELLSVAATMGCD